MLTTSTNAKAAEENRVSDQFGVNYCRIYVGDVGMTRKEYVELIAELRADLAAAVAERDSIRRNAQDLTECAMKTIPADWRPGYAWPDDGVMNVLAEYVDELRQRAEQAEARLAVIDAQPTVATICVDHDFMHIQRGLMLPPIGTELIARPAKEVK